MFHTSEQLESRRLLSVAVNFDYLTGTLSVQGRSDNEDIRVTCIGAEKGDHARPRVQEFRAGPALPGVSVYENGNLVFNSEEVAGPGLVIRNVDLNGGAGDDILNLWTYYMDLPTRVDGGTGADTIYVSAGGQARTTQAFGGEGDDFIQSLTSEGCIPAPVDGGAGNDHLLVIRTYGDVGRNAGIFGRDGNDLIELFVENGNVGDLVMAGADNDTIYGSSKADLLYGENGNDFIEAEDGNDYINGGLGDDWICGDEGDDFLDHGGGTDIVDGGDGYDVAVAGLDDKLLDVEELM
jgi:Ca2+-binding RTX toxin-like protein